MKFIKISISVAALLALISLAAYGQMGTAATDPAAKAVVDPNGDLRVPGDYRTSYQFLRSWAVADGVGQSPSQIHVVLRIARRDCCVSPR